MLFSEMHNTRQGCACECDKFLSATSELKTNKQTSSSVSANYSTSNQQTVHLFVQHAFEVVYRSWLFTFCWTTWLFGSRRSRLGPETTVPNTRQM